MPKIDGPYKCAELSDDDTKPGQCIIFTEEENGKRGKVIAIVAADDTSDLTPDEARLYAHYITNMLNIGAPQIAALTARQLAVVPAPEEETEP